MKSTAHLPMITLTLLISLALSATTALAAARCELASGGDDTSWGVQTPSTYEAMICCRAVNGLFFKQNDEHSLCKFQTGNIITACNMKRDVLDCIAILDLASEIGGILH